MSCAEPRALWLWEPRGPEPDLGESENGSWGSDSRGEELVCRRSVVGSGEFERSEDMLGMVNIRVWDKRKSRLEPEPNDSGPQDLVSEALIWALGLNAHFIFYPSIHRQTS